MSLDELVSQAREADVGPPLGAQARVQRALEAPRRRVWPLVLAGATAAALGAVITTVLLAPGPVESPPVAAAVRPPAPNAPTTVAPKTRLQLGHHTLEAGDAMLRVAAAPEQLVIDSSSGFSLVDEGVVVPFEAGHHVLAATPTFDERWAWAQRLERQGAYAGADALYARLGRGTGLPAETALVALATLRQERRHQPAAALEALDDADARFAPGALQPERAWLRIATLFELGRAAQARKAADAFVAAFPNDPHRVDAHWLGGVAAAQSGDAAAAEVSLSQVPPQSARGEDAAWWLATLALKANRKADAHTRLREYLERWPQGRFAADAKAARKALQR